MPKRLPIIEIDNTKYYFDAAKGELVNAHYPLDRFSVYTEYGDMDMVETEARAWCAVQENMRPAAVLTV